MASPASEIYVYTAKVAWTFYRQNRDLNRFLQSNNSISRANYFRILALASIDILITLPFGIVSIVLEALPAVGQERIPFYPGWTSLHSKWEVAQHSHADVEAAASGKSDLGT